MGGTVLTKKTFWWCWWWILTQENRPWKTWTLCIQILIICSDSHPINLDYLLKVLIKLNFKKKGGTHWWSHPSFFGIIHSTKTRFIIKPHHFWQSTPSYLYQTNIKINTLILNECTDIFIILLKNSNNLFWITVPIAFKYLISKL